MVSLEPIECSSGSSKPVIPQRTKTVPVGDDWQHEIKFDGFHVQIRKLGNEVELYSRSGSRFGRRFSLLCKVLRELAGLTLAHTHERPLTLGLTSPDGSRSAPFADLLDDYRPVAKHLSQDFLKFTQ